MKVYSHIHSCRAPDQPYSYDATAAGGMNMHAAAGGMNMTLKVDLSDNPTQLFFALLQRALDGTLIHSQTLLNGLSLKRVSQKRSRLNLWY